MKIRKATYREFAELEVADFQRLHRPMPGTGEVAWEVERRVVRSVLGRWDAIRDVTDEYAVRIRDPKSKPGQIPDIFTRTGLERERRDIASLVSLKMARVVTLRLRKDFGDLKPVARNMLGTIWLDLAEAMSGRGAQSECHWHECHQLFTPTRSDARFCCPSCKLKAHRARVAN